MRGYGTLGSGINVPARLLISRHFSRGHGPYSRPKIRIFLEKVHFLDEIRAICNKIATFSTLEVNFPWVTLILFTKVPGGMFIPGGTLISDPRVKIF